MAIKKGRNSHRSTSKKNCFPPSAPSVVNRQPSAKHPSTVHRQHSGRPPSTVSAAAVYSVWSKKLNIHFGFWRWGVNPFRLDSLLAQMNREVLSRLQIDPASSPTLLDLGCGYGATMISLAHALPEASPFGAKFHGVNLSTEQIYHGEKMVAEAGFSNRIQFHSADFQSLPFGQNFATEKPVWADGAVLLESACYADGADKAGLISELARVIKPGGRAVVVDGFRRHSRPFPPFLEKIYRRNMRHWHITELADIQLFTKKLEEAGFENVSVEDVSWPVLPSALHIPFVAFRLYFFNSSPEKKRYARALLHTLFMGLFKPHFGYFIVTANR